jgi:hypothetical protein
MLNKRFVRAIFLILLAVFIPVVYVELLEIVVSHKGLEFSAV